MATLFLTPGAVAAVQIGTRRLKDMGCQYSPDFLPTQPLQQSTFRIGSSQYQIAFYAGRLLDASPCALSSTRKPNQPGRNGLARVRRGNCTVFADSSRSTSGAVKTADTAAVTIEDRHMGGAQIGGGSGGQVDGGAVLEGKKLPAEERAPSGEKFKWAEAWYPAAITSDLDPKVPRAVTILGRPLVIWWDRNTSKWQVFHDQCPHRLAPLSEGRIHESGQLQCSYHGWTFGGDGSCGLIPQASNDRVKQSPRACAKAVPCVEHQGMVFVWPDLTEGARERAAKVAPPTVPELDDPSFSFDLSSRDMAYGGDTLIENLMDPAHVPFAHHNIMGNRSRATPLDFKVDEIYINGFRGHGQMGPAEFTAPCLFVLRLILPPTPPKKGKEPEAPPKEKKIALTFYCVPTTPGSSKVFFAFPSNFLPKIATMIPLWFKHLGHLTVLDSDMYFLHVMERRLEAQGGAGSWSRACYTPTASDSYVAAYRRWQTSFGGKGFDWGPTVDPRLPPTPPKEQIMERSKSHVAQCKVCQGAKRNFELLQYALAALSFAIIAALAVVAVTRRTPMSLFMALPLVLLAATFAFASERLGRFIYKSYHFSDYCHALVP